MKKVIFSLVVCLTFLCACSSEETPVEMSDTNSVQHETIQVKAVAVGHVVISRAGYDAENLPATLYFSIDQEGDDYDYENVKLVGDGEGGYTPSTDGIYWAWDEHENVDIRVWTSVEDNSATASGVSSLTLPADQTTEDGIRAADILGNSSADGGMTVNENTVNVRLKHLLSKVIFNFVSDDASLVPERLSLNGIPVSGLFDYDAVAFSGVAEDASLAAVHAHVGEPSDGTVAIEAILFPYDFLAGSEPTVSFYLQGQDREFKADLPPCTLEAGKAYLFNLKVNADSEADVEFVSASVEGWDDISSDMESVDMTTILPDPVDLGLSVKWASFNVGATTPEGFGGYYAWGETTVKESYDWSNYKWCNGTEKTITKYCTNTTYGEVDNLRTLESSDDIASVAYGLDWRMPTSTEFEELYYNCTWTLTTQNGIKGFLVTGPNGNSIFLPSGGYQTGIEYKYQGEHGCYWATALDGDNSSQAWTLYWFDSEYRQPTTAFGVTIPGNPITGNLITRSNGRSVRAVYDPTTLILEDFSIMPGETKEVTIDMNNSVEIRALQVQLVLPEGLTLAEGPTLVAERLGSTVDEFGETISATKTLSYNDWGDGNHMIVVNADDGIPFSGSQGAVISLKIKADESATSGNVSITLQDIELVQKDGEACVRPNATVCNVSIN